MWFTMNFNLSCNSDLVQTFFCVCPLCLSHFTGGRHVCNWAVCCFFGMMAAIKQKKIDNNLTVWDKILKKITHHCDDICDTEIIMLRSAFSSIYSKVLNVTRETIWNNLEHVTSSVLRMPLLGEVWLHLNVDFWRLRC